MRSRGMLMLVIAVVIGLLAMIMAARWVQGQKSSQTTRLVVAATNIELGTALTAEQLKSIDWPVDQLPAGAQTEADKLVGRVVLSSLIQGEPVLDARLAPPGAKAGLSALVPPGKRAMTVRVNDVVGVAGFALPGTFVDVLVNTQAETDKRQDNGPSERAISKIVLERILVLAVAQEVDRDNTKPKVVNAVTLELTPHQAELLDLARSVGTLSLVLRNQSEDRSEGTVGVTKDVLLGHGAAAAPAPAPAPAPVATVVRLRSQQKVVATVTPPPTPAPAPAAPAAQHCVDIIRGAQKITECF